MVVIAILAVPAVGAPAKYGEREVAELLEIAQAEKEPEARRARAVRELEHTMVRTHLGVLRRLMREEQSVDIRLSAAITLAALGDQKAPVDLLLVSAYDGTKTANCTRSAVLRALGQTRSVAAEFHLERALKQEPAADEPFYADDLCRALIHLGTPGARRLLMVAARDSAPAYRKAAMPHLVPIAKDPKDPWRRTASEAIHEAAEKDPDETVAEEAAATLLWAGLDEPGFFRALEQHVEPKVRTRFARALNRNNLTPARLRRLQSARVREKDPEVQQAMDGTLKGQEKQAPGQ